MSQLDKSKFELLWECYRSGQFGEKTLEWHKRHTVGFKEFLADHFESGAEA